MQVVFRKASIADVKPIHQLLMDTSNNGILLPRSLSQLYTHCRDFMIAEFDDKVVGCCALALIWENLAEIRTLYVQGDFRKYGLGRGLVERCMEEGKQLGITDVFCLTYQCDFFEKLGFSEVGKETLPHKIWADCLQCARFPDCDEVAMRRSI